MTTESIKMELSLQELLAEDEEEEDQFLDELNMLEGKIKPDKTVSPENSEINVNEEIIILNDSKEEDFSLNEEEEGANWAIIEEEEEGEVEDEEEGDGDGEGEENVKVVCNKEVRGACSVLGSSMVQQRFGGGSVIGVGGNITCVGTTRGHCLLFDPGGNFIGSIGKEKEKEQMAPVSSVAVSSNSSIIVVGHLDGSCVVWDVSKGKLLKEMHEHSIGGFGPDVSEDGPSPINFLSFLLDFDGNEFVGSKRFISVDDRGAMFLSKLNKVLMRLVLESQLILDGGKTGKALAVAPLPFQSSTLDLANLNLVAFASPPQRVHVISMKSDSTVSILFTYDDNDPPDPNSPSSIIPTLTWCSDSATATVSLAIIWGTSIKLIGLFRNMSRSSHLKYDPQHVPDLQFAVTQSLDLRFPCLCGSWLDEAFLALLVNESDLEIHVFDVRKGSLAQTISARNWELVHRRRRFRPPNEDLSTPPLLLRHYPACLGSYGNTVYFLGVTRMESISLLTWEEMLSNRISQGHWSSAIGLCSRIYSGQERSAGMRLPQNEDELRWEVSQHSAALFSSWIEGLRLDRENLTKSQFKHRLKAIGKCAVMNCRSVNRSEILFCDVSDFFASEGFAPLFMELLEPFILSGDLDKIDDPEVMQKLVQHFADRGQMKRIEQCILKLDISAMDFQQVVTLCQRHRLWSALSHIYVTALHDLITPLDCMLDSLETTHSSGDLNSCFKYLSSCSSPSIALSSLLEVVCYLFFQQKSTGAHTQSQDDTHPPRVSLLLTLDSQTFLKRVATPLFLRLSQENGSQIKTSGSCGHGPCQDSSPSVLIGEISEVLLRCGHLIGEGCLVQVHIFCAAEYAADRLIFQGSSLRTDFFHDMIHSLARGSVNSDDLREREAVLLSLVKKMAGIQGRKGATIDWSSVLTLAESYGFWKVAEFVYLKQQEYDKVLLCHLRDPEYISWVFDFIRGLLSPDSPLSKEEHNKVKEACLSHLKKLIEIDSTQITDLITEYFTSADHDRVMRQLDSEKELQFKFLRSIMTSKRKTVRSSDDSQSPFQITPDLRATYIELMCIYDPDSVTQYLSIQEDYPLDRCLAAVRAAGLPRATSFLLERTGDLSGALNILLSPLLNHLNLQETEEATTCLSDCIGLCQRNSQRLETEENRTLWFKLLDAVVNSLHTLRNSDPSHSFLQFLTDSMRLILREASGFVSLPSILSKIVNDHPSDTFGDFKFLILGMVDTYNYEKSMLETANHLMEHDMHFANREHHRKLCRASKPKSMTCSYCSRAFDLAAEKNIVLFFCQHCFHSNCIQGTTCPLCHATAKKTFTTKKHPPKSPTDPFQEGYQEDISDGDLQKDSTPSKRDLQRVAEEGADLLHRWQEQQSLRDISRLDMFHKLMKNAPTTQRASANPFTQATTSNQFSEATTTNPFSETRTKPSVAKTRNNPFSESKTNPFSETNPKVSSSKTNPFLETQTDPFSETTTNPFSE